ncbi:hypothetical protein F0562_024749 [Nyssa sinensis]|uniref:Uncharacterized protein n=1 Tax=Nyssa sinensis TaxID=561372 RepID=A0A5J5BET4_9ASTE|nr:hypothetical protein F0562_024749 [Nyssa sinensis]
MQTHAHQSLDIELHRHPHSVRSFRSKEIKIRLSSLGAAQSFRLSSPSSFRSHIWLINRIKGKIGWKMACLLSFTKRLQKDPTPSKHSFLDILNKRLKLCAAPDCLA